MTTTIHGTVSAPSDHALEVIKTDNGVEIDRARYRNGDAISISVYEPHTFVLRAVAADAPIDHEPGGVRHGALADQPSQQSAAPLAPETAALAAAVSASDPGAVMEPAGEGGES